MRHTLNCVLLTLSLLLVGIGNVWGETGTIKFGTNDVKITAASVTATDDLGNTWTITTEGTTSFYPQPTYNQFGSAKAPATSITFTTSLPKNVNIASMSAEFGGFTGTTGTITMKVDDTTIGTGSLCASNDVFVSSTSSADGKVLTVTITGIDKGVKCYNITYSIIDENAPLAPSLTTASSFFDKKIVTITNNDDDATVYYTTNGEKPTTSSSSFTGNGKTIELENTTTVKAFSSDGNNSSHIVSAKYTKYNYVSLPFYFDCSTDFYEGMYHSGLAKYTSSPQRLKFDNTNDYLLICFNQEPGNVTFDIIGNGISGEYVFDIQESSDGINFPDTTRLTNISNSVQAQTVTFTANKETRFIRWIYTKKDAGNVGIGNIKIGTKDEITPTTDDYVKVTKEPESWDGKYLIVYEDGTVAFDGSLTTLDTDYNTTNVIIKNNVIYSSENENIDASSFAISSIGGGVSIQNANGVYVGNNSSTENNLSSGSNPYINTIAFDHGQVTITSNNTSLKFNNASDRQRFRYYKSTTTGMKNISLYKKVGYTPIVQEPYKVTFYQNGIATEVSCNRGEELSIPDITDYPDQEDYFVGWVREKLSKTNIEPTYIIDKNENKYKPTQDGEVFYAVYCHTINQKKMGFYLKSTYESKDYYATYGISSDSLTADDTKFNAKRENTDAIIFLYNEGNGELYYYKDGFPRYVWNEEREKNKPNLSQKDTPEGTWSWYEDNNISAFKSNETDRYLILHNTNNSMMFRAYVYDNNSKDSINYNFETTREPASILTITSYYYSTTSPVIKELKLDETNTEIDNFEGTFDHVIVSRKIKPNVWNTFCLPFSMNKDQITVNFGEGAEIKQLESMTVNDNTYNLHFADVEDGCIKAGTPYMIRISNAINQIEVFDDIKVNTTDEPIIIKKSSNGTMSFIGNYTKMPLEKDCGNFYISNNLFYYAGENANVTLKGFRGYLHGEDNEGNYIKAFELSDESNNTDGIQTNLDYPHLQTIYTISGQQVSNSMKQLPKGLYIMGGKKVFVK